MLKEDGTVLVVDDDVDVREAVAELLLLNGFEVRLAESGQQALDILRRERVALILLDLVMPGMDAIAFRREQIVDRSIATVPFILMTGHVDCSARARDLGAAACLRKPIDERTLLAALTSAVPTRWCVGGTGLHMLAQERGDSRRLH